MAENMVVLENGEVWALDTLAEVGINPADTTPVEFIGEIIIDPAQDVDLSTMISHPHLLTTDDGFPAGRVISHKHTFSVWRVV